MCTPGCIKVECVPVCNMYLPHRALHQVLTHCSTPAPLPQGIMETYVMAGEVPSIPLFFPSAGFCAEVSVIALADGSRLFQYGDRAGYKCSYLSLCL